MPNDHFLAVFMPDCFVELKTPQGFVLPSTPWLAWSGLVAAVQPGEVWCTGRLVGRLLTQPYSGTRSPLPPHHTPPHSFCAGGLVVCRREELQSSAPGGATSPGRGPLVDFNVEDLFGIISFIKKLIIKRFTLFIITF